MRFVSIGLDRYGRFTDRRLEFDRAASVTIIHGANEAGKSTALAAVADALFGIEERSRFNFLHDYKSMRLSGVVVGADGRELSFARLKRRAATLVDPSTGAPLPEDCLAPFLGAHDRRAFLDIFGLDQTRLRKGGAELLKGGGDLEHTLLAAAPGLNEVDALRKRLAGSADEIFKPDRKAASQLFYRALAARDDARQEARKSELRVEEALRLREEAGLAAQARKAATEQEIEARLALARAQMLAAAAKELRGLDRLVCEREAMGVLPPVAVDFVARGRALIAALEKAREAADRAAQEAEAAGAALAAIEVDDAVLALAEDIETCDSERAAIEKELLSLQKRRDEALEATTALKRVAAQLDMTDVAALRARSPGAPLLARVESLVDRLLNAHAQLGQIAQERERDSRRREDVERVRAGLGPIVDPAPLKRRLAAFEGAEAREQTQHALENRLNAARRSLDERAARLGKGLGMGPSDPDALATAPLPSRAAAETGVRATKAASEEIDREQKIESDLAEKLARANARLAALKSGRPAPTESAIRAARDERDAEWAALRPLATGARTATSEDVDAAQRLDRAIAAADRLSDERQSETARLADLAQTELAIAEYAAGRDAAARRVEAARARCAAAETAWRSLWAPAGFEPAPGEGAIDYLREAEAISKARDEIRDEWTESETPRELVRADREACESLRSDLGLSPQGRGPLRMAEIRDAVSGIEDRFLKARDCDRDLAALERDARETTRREQEIRREIGALEKESAEVFPPLAIRAGAAASEARASLGLWREAQTLIAGLETAEKRVEGIENDRTAFFARAGGLAKRLGLATFHNDPFGETRALRRRLDAARQAGSRAAAERERLAGLEGARGRAAAEQIRARSALDAHLDLIGITVSPELAATLDRLEKAAALDERIKETRARVEVVAGSRGEVEIREGLNGRDDDDLARAAAAAGAAHESARAALEAAIERDTRARAALETLEQREGAAHAAQKEQDAAAEIAAAMERFTRDYAAARLLSAAIERYRTLHQNPIVERASRAFAALTGGAWSGVDVDYDAEPLRLAAARDGRLYGVEALSEGAADQLFLALRLAAVEEHARRASLLPFLADDLFVSFDEERTAAGIALLAELGRHTQVIVFTHHNHVVDVAQSTLKDAVQILRL